MQFLGQKWAIFGPKMSQKCLKLFFSLTALKVDEVSQVSSILNIKKVQKCPHLSQNQPKSQFLGQKWTIFGPKMSQKCPKLFFSLTALKVDEVGQVSSILDIKKVQKCPHLSQNQPKSQFLGQKWTIFGPKMSQKCPKLFFSLTALKVDEVGQVSSILDIEKVQNALIYPKISQNRSFWGKNGPFLAPK